MEYVTGAGISIISEETYNKFFKNIPLKHSNTKLHAYTEAHIQGWGQYPVHVRYKSYSTTLPLTVVAGSWEEIGSLKSVVSIGMKFSVFLFLSA